jgi:hypothetical protein
MIIDANSFFILFVYDLRGTNNRRRYGYDDRHVEVTIVGWQCMSSGNFHQRSRPVFLNVGTEPFSRIQLCGSLP